MNELASVEIAIVGAGFGGLGAAVRLARAGHRDFLILEKADDVGGTWRDNSYPGCACDVPSHLYSFSFAPNPHWSESFSGQAEIWGYLRGCVDRFGLRPHLRLGHGVEAAAWDEATQRWKIDTSQGRVSARYLILATGPLSVPALPAIPGLETFEGVSFHSARWQHEYDLRGKRVGVIGTGASAIQFVPRIRPLASSLTVFQRTPPWVIPKFTRPITRFERWVYRRVPGATRVSRALLYWTREGMGTPFVYGRFAGLTQRLARRHLHRQVGDPQLRAKLTPTYAAGCKRMLLANDYYPALTQPNVTLETESIREIRPHAVVTADGVEHEVDALIFGTGFHVTDSPAMGSIYGRGGVPLAEAFTPSMTALRGTTVAGFPNFFMLLGPNTGLGHTSVVLMIESQLRHIVDVLAHARRTGAVVVEPTERAQREWTQWIDARMQRTVWSLGGCVSWYLDSTGRNSTLWPGFATGFRLRLRRFHPDEYTWTPAGGGSRGTLLTPAVEEGHPINAGSLEGKTVLITGAARGIGAALARRAAARGARLALIGLEPELLQSLAGQLGEGHLWCEADVTDSHQLDAAVRKVVDATGRIDVVVANAGIAPLGTVALAPVDAIVRTIDVNLNGVVRTVAATLPHVRANKGYLLLISSTAAFTAMPGMAAYCASKAGVEQFGNVLRLELHRDGVKVGTAHPIWIDTDMVRDFREDLPSFGQTMRKLPWPLNTVVSVDRCADALLDGILRRRRKIYVPRAIGLVQALRTVFVGNRLAEAITMRLGRDQLAQMEKEVQALGRSFGARSTEVTLDRPL